VALIQFIWLKRKGKWAVKSVDLWRECISPLQVRRARALRGIVAVPAKRLFPISHEGPQTPAWRDLPEP
jgi:hypothetical protein